LVGLTADSRSFVTVQTESESNLWVSDPDGGHAKRITSGARTGDGLGGMTWTPDGRIVYVSRAGGHQDLWIVDADGGNPKQLTADSYLESTPSVTPDGRTVVFVSERDLKPHVWRLDLDGGTATQLTRGDGEYLPQLSADGSSVYFMINDPASAVRAFLWRVPIRGGEPEKVSEKGVNALTISPDGKLIAGPYWDEQDHRVKLATLTLDAAQTLKVMPIGPRTIGWMPDGRLTYVENAAIGNIWHLSLDGGQPVQITHFDADRLFTFAWARDGKKLAVARGMSTSDVVLVTDTGAKTP
jgi:Tol biopolymer transport system component